MVETLNVAQVASVLEVSKSTVYKLIRSEDIKAFKGPNGIYQIYYQDLGEYIRLQRSVNKPYIHTSSSDQISSGENEYSSDVSSGHDKSLRISRRQFLKGSLSLVLAFTIGATSEFTGGLAQSLIYEGFGEKVKQSRDGQEIERFRIEMIGDLFGGLNNDFSWSANLTRFVENYDLREFHRSNTIRASVALGSVLGLNENDWLMKALYTSHIPGPVQIDSNIIAVGSPVSDPVARLNLEYSGTSKDDLKRVNTPVVELPITYAFKSTETALAKEVARRYLGGEEREMRNSTIRVDGEMLDPPRLGHDRWLETDYLLITRMPNILSMKGFVSGSDVIIIGGTHGVGTEAIKLLLDSNQLLSEVIEKKGRARYFQILLPIVEISHGLVEDYMHSVPMKLGHPIVKAISIDPDRVFSHRLTKHYD